MEKGKIVRSRVDEVRRTGRSTQGVQFATPGKRDSIVAVARNTEREVEEEITDGVASDASDADDSESDIIDAPDEPADGSDQAPESGDDE